MFQSCHWCLGHESVLRKQVSLFRGRFELVHEPLCPAIHIWTPRSLQDNFLLFWQIAEIKIAAVYPACSWEYYLPGLDESIRLLLFSSVATVSLNLWMAQNLKVPVWPVFCHHKQTIAYAIRLIAPFQDTLSVMFDGSVIHYLWLNTRGAKCPSLHTLIGCPFGCHSP